MDYNEMLFAAAVRDLAAKLKVSAGEEYFSSLPSSDGSSINKQKHDQWMNETSLSNFVPRAFEMIKATAQHIRSLS